MGCLLDDQGENAEFLLVSAQEWTLSNRKAVEAECCHFKKYKGCEITPKTKDTMSKNCGLKGNVHAFLCYNGEQF